MPTLSPSRPGIRKTRATGRDIPDLARLLPMWPGELTDPSVAGRSRRVAALERALRAERRRGLAGCWTYDLARHWALLRWWERETRDLIEAEAAASRSVERGRERSPDPTAAVTGAPR
jgi:hypothetical protein